MLQAIYEKYYGEMPIKSNKLNAFMKDIGEEFRRYVIEGNFLLVPGGFGKISIQGFKPNQRGTHLFIDPITTGKVRKELQPTWTREDWAKLPVEQRHYSFFDNTHTDGYAFRIAWTRPQQPSKLKAKLMLYSFEPVLHNFRRVLSVKLKQGDYKNYILT